MNNKTEFRFSQKEKISDINQIHPTKTYLSDINKKPRIRNRADLPISLTFGEDMINGSQFGQILTHLDRNSLKGGKSFSGCS